MSTNKKWIVQYGLYDQTWEVDMVFNPGKALTRGAVRPKVEYCSSEEEAKRLVESLRSRGVEGVSYSKC